MSKETKIGLLVGLLFIVVFGLVLSQTASRPKEGEEGGWAKGGKTDGALNAKVAVPGPSDPVVRLPGPRPADDRRGAPIAGDPDTRPQPPAITKKKPSRETYRVQEGDTIEKVMRTAYGADFTARPLCDQVFKANNITTNKLTPRRVLQLPVLEIKTAIAAAPETEPRSPGGDFGPSGPAGNGDSVKPSGKTYTIASGDTLERIAKKLCGGIAAVEKIKALNPGLDPRRLKIGTVIKLPVVKDEPVASIR